METELDSIKSSRNYYKDQCESLLLSLSNTVQKQTPTYRTQDEVEEMIEAIQEQQAEKRRKLKEKLAEDRKAMEASLDEMKQQIANRDKMLQEQEEARTSLIEKLIEYKRMLKECQERQQRTEVTLSQLQSTNECLSPRTRDLDVSKESQQIEDLQIAHANEIKVLKKHITKLTKKLKHATNSLELCQSAQDESKADVTDLTNQIKMHEQKEAEMRQALEDEKRKQEDAVGLLKQACEEAKHFQDDAARYEQYLAKLAEEIKDKDAQIGKMNKELVDYLTQTGKTNEILEERRRENIELNLQLEDLKSQMQNEQEESREAMDKLEGQMKLLKTENDQLHSEIEELQSNANDSQLLIQKLQSQVDQEARLRKSAELARDNALTNLKNAYTLMNSSEAARHEASLEMEKLHRELDAQAGEREASAKEIAAQRKQIEALKKELEETKARTNEFAESIEQERNNWNAIKKNMALEWKQKLMKAEEEKHQVEEELNMIQDQYRTLVAENETRRDTLEHQAETLATVQEEAKHLGRVNRQLRQRLRSSGIAMDDDQDTEECQSCKRLEQQLKELTQRMSTTNEQLATERKENDVVSQNVSNLFAKLKRVTDETHDEDLKEEARRAALVVNSDAPLDRKLISVTNLCMSVVNTLVVKGVVSGTTTGGGDSRLLKSTISHMGRRIEDLQAQNKKQNEEIFELRNDVQEAFRNRDQFESEMASISRSLRSPIGSSRQRGRETAGKQLDSDISKSQTESNSVLDVDDDFPSFSQQSDHKHLCSSCGKRQEKMNALTDSLALLDLLCQ